MESVSGAVSCWIRMPRGETDDRETGRRRSFPLARAVDEDKEMDENTSVVYTCEEAGRRCAAVSCSETGACSVAVLLGTTNDVAGCERWGTQLRKSRW
jgi:hypothetical protein